MTWNNKHVNEIRYKEPDLQQAYQHYKDLTVFYEVQIARKYKTVDNSPIQEAWSQFIKLRKHYGYDR